MADIPVFALPDALERVDNDVELLKELIQIFLQEYDRESAKLLEALAAQDKRLFTRLSHSLKGAAANVGAMRVADVAAALESLDGDADAAKAQGHLQRLSAAVEEFRARQQVQLQSKPGKA